MTLIFLHRKMGWTGNRSSLDREENGLNVRLMEFEVGQPPGMSRGGCIKWRGFEGV